MPDTILVVVEQREGKLNRVSWETLTAGQALAAETGWTLEAAVVGSGVAPFANEVAAKKVSKVYAVDSPKLEPYTPDAFAAALKRGWRMLLPSSKRDFQTGGHLRAQPASRKWTPRRAKPIQSTGGGPEERHDAGTKFTATTASPAPSRCRRADGLS